ncbi:sulfite reductase flavoprotein subunit alpha [Marinomonas sp. C2222]|uniref:Sulfite reductase [NADPH] flavoprotein alpha-component n=1 Tax=Marinomonas sargassi TaxID=2984494 RepID=A0ABT2YRM3_9GAMM|nr:sulfite reductase flavoprotein subunit alpha [Marinomonas sargassi]MCV2402536.1 sulfite reductase flavoprotein subunit alpha [Marinomonas sargassi]
MSHQEDKTQNKNAAPSLGFIPQDIPFNDEQRQWLGGFFAGLHSKLMVVEGSTTQTAAPTSTRPITIIYGTQTGNAEGVAELAAEQAKALGLSPVVLDMDDVSIDQFSQIERLLIVTSTYGEGEMPDNAQALWDAISEDSAPQLAQLNYSVLALGDTSYDEFCLAGKLWDERLAELGANRVGARVDCDVAFEEPAQSWMDAVIPAIAEKGSDSAGAASTVSTTPKAAKSKFNRTNPLMATLTTKKVLTHPESSKEVMHFEFSLGDSGETYQAGDALNIIPLNRVDLVEELLGYFDADGSVTLAGADKALKQQLIEELEIRTPSKELVSHIASLSDDTAFKALIDNDDKAGLSDFLWAKDSLDLLIQYQDKLAGKLSIEEFVGLCKPLAPRAYSISSSIKKHDGEVHLTIGSVRYNAQDRDHNGVCSTFLADEANEGDSIACYFSPNKNFAIPEDGSLPIIMVGPGTGIAPFRSFLEEREMTGASGKNWLFFGDRNSKTDFLYRDELEAMQEKGLLNQLDLAFSRDQSEKVYVQDKMREQGAQLFADLESGGYFYICGDALRMAKDVDQALHDVIEKEGNMSAEQAADYVNALKKNKRYVRDVY